MNAFSFSDPPPEILTPEQEVLYARAYRDMLLNDSDWTQMPDSPLSSEQKQIWAVYRQELRNITQHPNWPKMQWPTNPGTLK